MRKNFFEPDGGIVPRASILRFIGFGFKGSAHDGATFRKRWDFAERMELHDDVADGRGLDRFANDHAIERIGGKLVEEIVPASAW